MLVITMEATATNNPQRYTLLKAIKTFPVFVLAILRRSKRYDPTKVRSSKMCVAEVIMLIQGRNHLF